MLYIFALLLLPLSLFADLSAEDVMQKVEFINRAKYAKNVIVKKTNKKYSITVRRTKKTKPLILLAERYLNNDYSDGKIISKDLIIIRSGKLKGTGVLITEFADKDKSQEYMLWLPALRKVRRIAQPDSDGGLAEVEVAFIEETKLRTVSDEKHKIVKKEPFVEKMGYMKFKEQSRHLQLMPQNELKISAKEVYVIESTPLKETWYDKRLSYVDSKTFVDYRNEYFYKGNKVKVIDRRWKEVPNIKSGYYWYYWYLKNLETGYETVTFVPDESIAFNQKKKSSFWSKRTLTKIKR